MEEAKWLGEEVGLPAHTPAKGKEGKRAKQTMDMTWVEGVEEMEGQLADLEGQLTDLMLDE